MTLPELKMQFMSRPTAGTAGSAGDTEPMQLGRIYKGWSESVRTRLSHSDAKQQYHADHWADVLSPKRPPRVKQPLDIADRVVEVSVRRRRHETSAN